MQAQIGTSSFFAFVVPFMLLDPQLDLTPGSIGGMYAVGGIIGAFVSPFIGRLVDRFGSRVCLPFGFVGLSLSMILLSSSFNPAMVAAGFFGCRLFAIGALHPMAQVTINQWFDKKRGRVTGTMMVITTFIRSGPYAVAYESAVETYGWRTTQRYGAMSCLILALPVMLLVFYRPEDVDCLPDGVKKQSGPSGLSKEEAEARGEEQQSLLDSEGEGEGDDGDGNGGDSSTAGMASQYDIEETDSDSDQEAGGHKRRPAPTAAAAAVAPADYTLHEALRTSQFYLLNADTLVGWMFGAGISFHLVNIILSNTADALVAGGGEGGGSGGDEGEGVGESVDVALHVYFPMGLAGAGANFVTGVLLDWAKARPKLQQERCFVPKYILVFIDVLQGCTMMFLPIVNNIPRAVAFGLAFGTASGARGLMQATVYAEFFGRTHLGSIQGTAQSVNIMGTGLGPFILGLGYDTFGSFGPVLRVVALLPLVMAVVQMCCLHKPPSRDSR